MTAKALHVAIIASGSGFQEAAAWSAPTYVKHLPTPGNVAVYLPADEKRSAVLEAHSQKFGFSIKNFPFARPENTNPTSQLKCQGFWQAVSMTTVDELLFLVDADTYCSKPLTVPDKFTHPVLQGKLGLVKDIQCRHSHNPKEPWHLARVERLPYVNSGVILTSKNALELFTLFLEFSKRPEFIETYFQDQTIINFALGKHFRDRLLLLDKEYNGIGTSLPTTIIGHCAGGTGHFGRRRSKRHLELCSNILLNQKSNSERMGDHDA